MIDITGLREDKRPQSSTIVHALLDRLEAAEKSDAESIAMYRNARDARDDLRAKIEQTEISKREISEAHNAVTGRLSVLADENTALQAKIEQMEQQRPFAWIVRGGYPVPLENLEWQLLCGAERPTLSWTNQEMRPLYALPGAQAQPAPSVPGINEGVRKVTLGFRWESEAQHHIPTIEIEFDPVSPDSPNDAKGWQDRDRIASMLTPEAKPLRTKSNGCKE